MRKTVILLCTAGFILLACAAAALVTARMRQEEALSAPASTVSPNPSLTLSGETPDLQDNSRLSPEAFREQVLLPVLACHPGTAGSSLKAAYASAVILDFATGQDLHTVDQDSVNRLMADAVALLTEEEQAWLPESTAGVVDCIEKTFSDYEGIKGVYEDSGSDALVLTALDRPNTAADWAKLKTAFDTCLPVDNTVITEDMAYEGIRNYCRSVYDWSVAEDNPDIMYLAMGEETESEYQVIFRSYTGSFVYFYVDRQSGLTRTVESVPALQTEEESGTFQLFDYL